MEFMTVCKKRCKSKITVTTTRSINFVETLQIVFIVLKLIGKITWSWLWVLSPLWISAAIAIVAILITVIWITH